MKLYVHAKTNTIDLFTTVPDGYTSNSSIHEWVTDSTKYIYKILLGNPDSHLFHACPFPPLGGPPWDQPHPGALGPRDTVKYQLWTKGNKNLFLKGKTKQKKILLGSKWNQLLIHATIWINLNIIVLNTRHYTDVYHMIQPIENTK